MNADLVALAIGAVLLAALVLAARARTEAAQDTRAGRRAARRTAVVIGVLLVAAGCGIAALVLDDARQERESACAERSDVAALGAEPGRRRSADGRSGRRGGRRRRGGARPSLVAIGAQGRPATGPVSLRMTFGSGRDPVVRRQTFRVDGLRPAQVRAVIVNDFANASGDRTMPVGRRQLRVTVHRLPATRRMVQVRVCYDPGNPVEIDPGSYSGGIVVLGGAAPPASIGVTVTARDSRLPLAVVAAAVGLLAGLFVRVAADHRWAEIRIDGRYFRRFGFWVMAGGGVATAVYSYLTIVEQDPVFDGSLSSLWRLTAETFAGTLAAKAIVDLARPAGDAHRGRQEPGLDPRRPARPT